MLSGVLPHPFQPTSPLAPDPAAASDSATAAINAMKSHDALARLIPRESYLFATDIDRARSRRRFDAHGLVEAAVDLVHEMRRRVHVQVERAHRSFCDRELEPRMGLRVEERDAPRGRGL